MKRIPALLVAIGLLVVFSGTAFAAKGGIPGPPGTTQPITTTTPPEYWTCQARVDNGATGWVLGSWDETVGAYTVPNVPACIDILTGDLDTTAWRVEWKGSTVKGTVKGVKLVFEAEVHGTVYAETVVTSEIGTWETGTSWGASWPATEIGNLVFVAMPHSGDRWVGPVTFVVTPLN